MEHTNNGDYAVAALSGLAFAIFEPVTRTLKFLLSTNPYSIDWAETFQVSWKAAVGAVVGLSVTWVWNKLINPKKRRTK